MKHHVVFTDRVVYTRNFHYFERQHSLDRCHRNPRLRNCTLERLASIFDAVVLILAENIKNERMTGKKRNKTKEYIERNLSIGLKLALNFCIMLTFANLLHHRNQIDSILNSYHSIPIK